MTSPETTIIYQNPVYPNYFADPFVWKHGGEYFAVGTGPIGNITKADEQDMTSQKIGGVNFAFPLLHSADFVHWQPIGGALEVPSFAAGGAFWAPEVAFHDGKFYLYYSVATSGLHHVLRGAVSDSPTGPFIDFGTLMEHPDDCPFAIDAHPFLDDDGQWYLFYATDFLDSTSEIRAGTALVMDKLLNMRRLAGRPRVVIRARSNWQRFQANRSMYGQILDWHTLEGPCVRKHEGKYYCFYSGGCYLGSDYGIDYGIAQRVTGPYSDSGNEGGARVLQSVPGHVLGPGHHSIVLGPDDRTEYVVYHAWDPDMTARRMCIDKLIWTAEGPRVLGPTWTPQRETY